MLMDAIRTADWVLLMAQDPGLPIRPAGILLLDPLTDKLHIALDDFVSTDEDIREVWESLKEELADKASEMGGARLLDWLEEDLSLFLQLQPRQYIATANPEQALEDLFKEHVLNGSSLLDAPTFGDEERPPGKTER
jgi:hypothetical protein